MHIHPQAYHLNLHYPRHTFITIGWYASKWWLVENPSLSCTPQQRESVLPFSLAVLEYVFIEDLNMTTHTGIVSPLSAVYIAHTKQDYVQCEQISETDVCFAADWWAVLC